MMTSKKAILELSLQLWCSNTSCSPRFPIWRTLCWDYSTFSYSCVSQKLKQYLLTKSEYGLLDKYTHNVYINNEQSITYQRFTAAHELGHILFNHQIDSEENDAIANCFATFLLCPIPIADFFGLSSPDEYSKVFDVPLEFAKYAFLASTRVSKYVSKYQRDYLEFLMNLYMRNYICVSEYLKDIDHKIFRNVAISNHPLYFSKGFPIVLQTLHRMNTSSSVLQNSSLISYPYFRQALTENAIDKTWKEQTHNSNDDYHPFIISYRYGY